MANKQRRSMDQHWSDRAYLEAWCDPETPAGYEPYVWTFAADSRVGKPKSPKKLFKEPHMYTRAEGDPFLLERGLQRLNDEFLRVRDGTLMPGWPLTPRDCAVLCNYAVAAYARTPKQRTVHQALWGRMHEIADDLASELPAEERARVPIALRTAGGKDGRITLSDLRKLAEAPLQHTVIPATIHAGQALAGIPLRIVWTAGSPGFITSDAAAVILNFETYPQADLKHPATEVTLPLTPKHMAVWRSGWTPADNGSYLAASDGLVDLLNRRTRVTCERKFVVQKNVTRDEWFEQPGAK